MNAFDIRQMLHFEKVKSVSPEILRNYHTLLPEQEEATILCNSVQYEMALLHCVRDGDLEELEKRMPGAPWQLHFGHFSDNQFRGEQYLYVYAIALVTRYALIWGLPAIQAYTLCEVYTQKTDSCKDEAELWHYFNMAIIDFTGRVHANKNNSINSYPVLLSITYISNYIYEKITLKKVAAHCQVTVPYLSALFKKEMHINFNEYLCREKMKAAATLLTESSLSVMKISEMLSYSSSSSFGMHFRREYGVTPSRYRYTAKTK